MGKIMQLDPRLQNMIAAGEVVERLANVVKELVENAIDAEATEIDISLEESGFKKIVVQDNGSGMDEADASACFNRHATSKIRSEYDLFHIHSLGFRGEALPAIASVSHVVLTTTQSDGAAIQLIYHDGRMIDKTSTSAKKGTRVEVSRLFYHTPARYKYLKSPQTELSEILSLINAYAIGHPKIAFSLMNNGKSYFHTSGSGDMREIFARVYGLEVAKSMHFFSGSNRDYRISGYAASPLENRASRKYMSIFVNHRVIKNYPLTQVFERAYHQKLPIKRFPIVHLDIEVDPQLIDVNVHPNKLEIKFSETESLHSLVYSTISNMFVSYRITETAHLANEGSDHPNPESYYTQTLLETDSKDFDTLTERFEVRETNDARALAYIGQLHGTYLIFQNSEGMLLIDQHAAAERIRYESYRKAMSLSHNTVYDLLIPLELSFKDDISIHIDTDFRKRLADWGVTLLPMEAAESRFQVLQIPSWFPQGQEVAFVEEMVMYLLDHQSMDRGALQDEIAVLLACKRSIKANQYVDSREAYALVSQLELCTNPDTCPHGRPIRVMFRLRDIEKWFKRTE
jgi:DNA mismatch repair protein MutL